MDAEPDPALVEEVVAELKQAMQCGATEVLAASIEKAKDVK